ncbi:hypothetical protein ACIRPK_36690 [Kitasatospora sp. NPDC101801]|uniref:hypothetical protein n=1 Tax=Kitasatospora sp. NPDC101801 TaxID=3364103 RepID=UPI003813DF43
MNQILETGDLSGFYEPAAPGARTVRDTRPLFVGSGRVTVVVEGRTAYLFIGGSAHLVHELPATFERRDVHSWAQQVAAELAGAPVPEVLPEPLQELPAGLSYRMEAVTGHGSGAYRTPVNRGRYVVLVDGESPWATRRPEDCLDTSDRGVWLGGAVLVCLSCGLDCT